MLKKRVKYGILGGIAGSVAGGITGFGVGIAAMPIAVAVHLTAPISYPLMAGASGILKAKEDSLNDQDTAQLAFSCAAIGAIISPSAPFWLLTVPLLPIQNTVIGTVAGGVGGAIIGVEEGKKQEKKHLKVVS